MRPWQAAAQHQTAPFGAQTAGFRSVSSLQAWNKPPGREPFYCGEMHVRKVRKKLLFYEMTAHMNRV
jgi:hypothetical protein